MNISYVLQKHVFMVVPMNTTTYVLGGNRAHHIYPLRTIAGKTSKYFQCFAYSSFMHGGSIYEIKMI